MFGRSSRARLVAGASLLASVVATTPAAAEPADREARFTQIRDAVADNGISTGYLFAGIASAETNLSHCWSELTWACEGPGSPDCDGGPVVAGAGDGPCSIQEGGLGMFQFDGGNFDETIARDGDGVLLIRGNVTKAVDFVVDMVIRSQYTDATNVETAKEWLNQVTVDGPLWDAWIKTVTHYYNGCTPTGCSVYNQRYAHYDENGRDVFDEQGAEFWDVELPPCGVIPPEGRALEETDTCFTKGGPLSYWRVGIGGESNLHVWTGTTAETDAVNFADWSLDFAEAGEYLVEVSVSNGTSTTATYSVEHAGAVDDVTIDQTGMSGYVVLGSFQFAAGPNQGIFLGDNTGVADEHLVADAVRVTRVDVPGEGGGSPNGSGGFGEGGSGEEGGAGGSDTDGDRDDGGCSVSGPGTKSRGGIALAAMLATALIVRRSRRSK